MRATRPDGLPFVDLGLARRLEGVEARANAASVAARAGLWPESGAGWSEAGGALVMFDGPTSSLTQAFGLGAAGAEETAAADGRVALLAGASTIPTGRRHGAQQALVRARVRSAADHGCDLAMMCALLGSASQRNAERHGFRIACIRVKWCRE